jgi:hypothetical protein
MLEELFARDIEELPDGEKKPAAERGTERVA